MHEEIDYFAVCVLGDEPLYPDSARRLVDIHTMEATYESAATDHWISLD